MIFMHRKSLPFDDKGWQGFLFYFITLKAIDLHTSDESSFFGLVKWIHYHISLAKYNRHFINYQHLEPIVNFG